MFPSLPPRPLPAAPALPCRFGRGSLFAAPFDGKNSASWLAVGEIAISEDAIGKRHGAIGRCRGRDGDTQSASGQVDGRAAGAMTKPRGRAFCSTLRAEHEHVSTGTCGAETHRPFVRSTRNQKIPKIRGSWKREACRAYANFRNRPKIGRIGASPRQAVPALRRRRRSPKARPFAREREDANAGDARGRGAQPQTRAPTRSRPRIGTATAPRPRIHPRADPKSVPQRQRCRQHRQLRPRLRPAIVR